MTMTLEEKNKLLQANYEKLVLQYNILDRNYKDLCKTQEALKMAIEAFDAFSNDDISSAKFMEIQHKAIQACKEALEQEEPFISFSQKEWMNQIALAYQAGKDSK